MYKRICIISPEFEGGTRTLKKQNLRLARPCVEPDGGFSLYSEGEAHDKRSPAR